MSNYTDKELLELAAKAAGLNVKMFEVDQDDNFSGLIVGTKNTREKIRWNPITNDGDALRLAVKLKLDFYVDEKDAGCWISDFVCLYEDSKQDPYAATRRAITRAAAAIGSKL